jgi:similar to spore coat protein
MNTIMENVTGMNALTDQVIATDLLIAAKAGVKNLAIAITETTSPEVRATLTKQLNEAITFQAGVSGYMIKNGYYKPYHMGEQIKSDIQAAETALNLPTI